MRTIKLIMFSLAYPLTNKTKSSAVAERPRDASCHWVFC